MRNLLGATRHWTPEQVSLAQKLTLSHGTKTPSQRPHEGHYQLECGLRRSSSVRPKHLPCSLHIEIKVCDYGPVFPPMCAKQRHPGHLGRSVTLWHHALVTTAASWEQSHTRCVGCKITLCQDDLIGQLFSPGHDMRRDGTCVGTCSPPCVTETSPVSLFPLAGTWAQAPCCLLGAQCLPSGCPEVLMGAKEVRSWTMV